LGPSAGFGPTGWQPELIHPEQVERLEAELEVYQMKNSSLTKQVQHGAAHTQHARTFYDAIPFPE